MTISSGLRSGLQSGLRSGLNPGSDPLANVTRDATSGIYCPANATEWAAVMSVAGIASGGPSLLWNMQEASGSIADSIGSFTGTAGGTGISYQQAVSGWTRRGISTTAGATGTFNNTAAGLPDIATASVLFLQYMTMTAVPSTSRGIGGIGSTGALIAQSIATSSFLRLNRGGTLATGSNDIRNAVRPYVICHNETASTQKLYSNQEKLTLSFQSSAAGKGVGTHSYGTGTAAAQTVLYAAAFFNAAAELTDAQLKTLLQTLGWTIPWS